MLPVATPTNAIVFSNGHVKMIDMVNIIQLDLFDLYVNSNITFNYVKITTGLFINLFGIAVVFMAANTWLGAIFSVDDYGENGTATALNSFAQSYWK